MRKYFLILLLLVSAAGFSQTTPNIIYGKEVVIQTRDTSSAELTIKNSTRNVLGYFKNIGGGKGQYVIIPQADITGLPDSLLARYTKAQADARFKSISYVPAWLDITGKPANFSTTHALSNDIQDSLLNKVSRDGSYANPSWITSLDYSKLTGTVPTWNQNTTGNAATVTNGVYTTGSYANPSWITELAWSKVSGAPAFITGINSSMVTTALGYTPENLANKGVANGYADLDASGKIPASRIDFGQTGQTFVVASQAAMLAVSGANVGALAIRTDQNKNYRLIAQPASTLANWQVLLSPDAPVQSVNGFTGNVNLLTTHISEGSNYWWTAARSRAAQSLTTSGSSGAATYDNTTGVLNIPTYTLAGLGGQPALSGTGFVKISGTTITYDNSTYLTSYTETDPTIYAWAKATTKPSYSWGEITGTVPTWNQNTTGTAANVTGVVSIANGGTGSSTQNFVDLSTTQTISGAKTFSSTLSAQNISSSGTITARGGTTSASLGATTFIGAGELLATGSTAGLFFENRSGGVTSNTNWAGWYYSGSTIRLWNGSTDIFSFNASTGTITGSSASFSNKINVGGASISGNSNSFYNIGTETSVAIKQESGGGQLALALWNNGSTGEARFLNFFTETAATSRGNIKYNRTTDQLEITGAASGLLFTGVSSFSSTIRNFNGSTGVDILVGQTIRGTGWTSNLVFETTNSSGVINSNQLVLNGSTGNVSLSGALNATAGTFTDELFTSSNLRVRGYSLSGDFGSGYSISTGIGASGATARGINIGWNTTNDVAFIGSVHNGQAWKSISIQPIGGSLLVGTTTQSSNGEKIQISGEGLFTGKLRLNSSASTSVTGSAIIIRPSNLNLGQSAIVIKDYLDKDRWVINGQNGASDYTFALYSAPTGTNDYTQVLGISQSGVTNFINTVSSTGFIKSGSSDSYFLLGGGGHVATSTYATTESLSGYVDISSNQYEIGGNKTFLADVVVNGKLTGARILGSTASYTTTATISSTITTAFCSGSSYTLTLPSASGVTGQILTVISNSSLTGITLSGVEGGSYTLICNSSLVLVSNGTTWKIASSYQNSAACS